MKDYNDLSKYIYPPRPEIKSPPSGLKTYERMGFWGQPKMNGSCSNLFLGPGVTKPMGRHNNLFAREIISRQDLQMLHRGSGPMILTGEYMNKSQKDVHGKPFIGFVIFDILVYNGKHLLGVTFQERQELLDSLYTPLNSFDEFIWTIGPSAYRAKNFTSGFEKSWNYLTSIQMYEGFVLKRPDAKLEQGFKEVNNTKWQLKIRKPTANYKY
jgi:hypothetical protein